MIHSDKFEANGLISVNKILKLELSLKLDIDLDVLHFVKLYLQRNNKN
jgi:hypothetical protein